MFEFVVFASSSCDNAEHCSWQNLAKKNFVRMRIFSEKSVSKRFFTTHDRRSNEYQSTTDYESMSKSPSGYARSIRDKKKCQRVDCNCLQDRR